MSTGHMRSSASRTSGSRRSRVADLAGVELGARLLAASAVEQLGLDEPAAGVVVAEPAAGVGRRCARTALDA